MTVSLAIVPVLLFIYVFTIIPPSQVNNNMIKFYIICEVNNFNLRPLHTISFYKGRLRVRDITLEISDMLVSC